MPCVADEETSRSSRTPDPAFARRCPIQSVNQHKHSNREDAPGAKIFFFAICVAAILWFAGIEKNAISFSKLKENSERFSGKTI